MTLVKRLDDRESIPGRNRVPCVKLAQAYFQRVLPHEYCRKAVLMRQHPLYFFKIHFKMILTSASGSSEWFRSLGYFTRTLCFSLRHLSASCSDYLILRDFMTLIILYLAWNTYFELLCVPSQSSCSFLLGPHIFLCLLFPNTSPRVLLVMWETEFRTNTAQHAIFLNFLWVFFQPHRRTDVFSQLNDWAGCSSIYRQNGHVFHINRLANSKVLAGRNK